MRIHGLTALQAASRKAAAELVIFTEPVYQADADAAACLRVRARLLNSDGVALWERLDEVDPDDLEAVHRAVMRTLTEGMGRTAEGGGVMAGLRKPRLVQAP